MVRSQITADTNSKIHICKKCLTHFTKLDLFEKHITYCSQNETVAVKMPTKNTILNFQNHYKKLPIPFVVYADFECFTKPINSCQPNPNPNPKHEPSGYCIYLKGLDGIKDNYKLIVYTKKSEDDNISEKFIKHLKIITHSIYRKYYLKPKVHRGIKFYQSKWMEPYIRKNTDLRKLATSSFEKGFFKVMNNSVFGKTIENIRKRQNVILVDNKDMAYKLSSNPNFDRSTIFDENLIACHMKKTEEYFNKPIYVGQAILDLSKTLMFDFHYNYIREKFGDKAELLFTDTDSLMYLIQTDDFYQDINKDIKRKFDRSDYPEKHPSGIKTGINKKVIGKWVENK